MKNLKQYEIEAIIDIIVKQITPQIQHKISPKKLKQMEIDSEKIGSLQKQIDILVYKKEKIYNKYERDKEVNIIYNGLQRFVPRKVEVDFIKKQQIKNEIIISSIANKDIEKLIDQLVKKYSI